MNGEQSTAREHDKHKEQQSIVEHSRMQQCRVQWSEMNQAGSGGFGLGYV